MSIATLTGDSGVLTKAQEAKEKTEVGKKDELIQLTAIEAANNLENQLYTDKNGDTATIPVGFAVSQVEGENTIEDGLVIIDNKCNEFVWVPISNINEIAKETLGKDDKGRINYQGKLYSFSGKGENVSSSEMERYGQGNILNMREPSLVTGNRLDSYAVLDSVAGSQCDADSSYYHDILGYNSAIEFGKVMQEEYNTFVWSVNEYGGFYVGRYETSITGTTVASIARKLPMTHLNWYKMYLYQSSNYKNNPFYSNVSVTSSMIWGSQWDAMLNWILIGSDKEKVTETTNGNHSGSVSNTGTTTTDIMNNIYDLEGNVTEWTQEAWYEKLRIFRGGRFDKIYPASVRSHWDTYVYQYYGYFFGSRLALLIN